jgi:hypothetical protein
MLRHASSYALRARFKEGTASKNANGIEQSAIAFLAVRGARSRLDWNVENETKQCEFIM